MTKSVKKTRAHVTNCMGNNLFKAFVFLTLKNTLKFMTSKMKIHKQDDGTLNFILSYPLNHHQSKTFRTPFSSTKANQNDLNVPPHSHPTLTPFIDLS